MLSFWEKVFIEIKALWITWHTELMFLFECLSVTSYEQFIVSIVELIMLLW